MSLTQTQRDFLNILRAVFSNRPLPAISKSSDWISVFQLAEIQHLLPLVYDAVRVQQFASPTVFNDAKRVASSLAATQIANTVDWLRVYEELRREGLHPVALKGMLCAALYPQPSLRVTADLDLLTEPEEFDACRSVLCRLGLMPKYDDDTLANDYEVSFFSEDRSVCIELHRTLFSAEEAELNGCFTGMFASVQEHDGLLTLDPEKHMLFLLLHAYKHFIYSGIGVRSVCDIGLWAQKYVDVIEWERLYQLCASVQAEVFSACVFRIAREYIGLDFQLPDFWRDAEIDCEPLLIDMLEGGVYGSESLTRLHSANTTLSAVHADRRGSHSNGFLRAVFPGRSYLQSHYPYAKRHPVLLPAAWCHRLLRYVREVGTNDRSSASGSIRLAKQRIQLLRDYKIIR